MTKTNNTMILTKASTGTLLRLVEINAGRGLKHRLVEMGLTPGVEFKILQDAGGPLLLAVRDSRIAIGRKMALKVLVEMVTT